MTATNPVLSIIACGAGPAADVGAFVKQAAGRGWTAQVIATPSALPFIDVSEIEQLTGIPVRSQYSTPGAPRSRIPDAIIVAPATFNTINQWALGLSGTYALGVLAEQTGLGIPIVAVPFVSEALASRPPFKRSLTALRAEGVSVLLGSDAIMPHPTHAEDDHLADFPWHLALDEVTAMTGLCGLSAITPDIRTSGHLSGNALHCQALPDRYGGIPMTDTAPVTGRQRVLAACSFCMKSSTQVRKLIAGPGVYICDECVDLCGQIIADEFGRPATPGQTGAAGQTGSVSQPATPGQPPRLPLWDQVATVDEALDLLPKMAAAGIQVEENLTALVRRARALGATWARVGEALGMTRQSAWERFSGEE
jgi:hypothetical protein